MILNPHRHTAAVGRNPDIARELSLASFCMRSVAAEWRGIPGRYRFHLINCANRADAALRRHRARLRRLGGNAQ
jgi:hypothetical protein